jgi:GNAT superfamily N-acetyltransferase
MPIVLRMIRGLAEYERMSHRVMATESMLRDAMFGERSFVEALLAHVGEEAVGVAIFFPNFSTFAGKPGLHLEDLFVEPSWRGRGIGRKLLARVAEIAMARGCSKLTWAVLTWNEPAMQFYARLGAGPVSDWVSYSLTGEPLATLAGEAEHDEAD